ncbi:MAG TPA: Fe-S cluster assembly protein SufD [Stenomitos sp.]
MKPAIVELVKDPTVASLLRTRPELPETGLMRVAMLRREAVDRLSALALPTIKDEEWRFTNLAPLKELVFQAPERKPEAVTLDQIERFVLPESRSSRLVFVNGAYAPHLSDVSALGDGVTVQNLADAGDRAHLLDSHLGKHAAFQDEVFTALNTAFLGDGALVHLGRERVAPAPIHLLFLTVPGTETVLVTPRVLVVAEAMSEAVLVEDYVSLADGATFTSAVTELFLADDARIKHVRLQRENRQAYHLGRSAAVLGRDAAYASYAVTLGGAFTRHEPSVLQTAEGTDTTMQGLTLIGSSQFADTHSVIDHAKPHGTSNQLHKCILGGTARGVFNGKILVRQHAAQTNSAQANRNLLLSEKARIDTKPQLEIFNEDVRCSHGATVGQIEPEEIFYLRSRGLSEADARHLLVFAFAAEILDGLPVASLKEDLRRHALEQMASAQEGR